MPRTSDPPGRRLVVCAVAACTFSLIGILLFPPAWSEQIKATAGNDSKSIALAEADLGQANANLRKRTEQAAGILKGLDQRAKLAKQPVPQASTILDTFSGLLMTKPPKHDGISGGLFWRLSAVHWQLGQTGKQPSKSPSQASTGGLPIDPAIAAQVQAVKTIALTGKIHDDILKIKKSADDGLGKAANTLWGRNEKSSSIVLEAFRKESVVGLKKAADLLGDGLKAYGAAQRNYLLKQGRAGTATSSGRKSLAALGGMGTGPATDLASSNRSPVRASSAETQTKTSPDKLDGRGGLPPPSAPSLALPAVAGSASGGGVTTLAQSLSGAAASAGSDDPRCKAASNSFWSDKLFGQLKAIQADADKQTSNPIFALFVYTLKVPDNKKELTIGWVQDEIDNEKGELERWKGQLKNLKDLLARKCPSKDIDPSCESSKARIPGTIKDDQEVIDYYNKVIPKLQGAKDAAATEYNQLCKKNDKPPVCSGSQVPSKDGKSCAQACPDGKTAPDAKGQCPCGKQAYNPGIDWCSGATLLRRACPKGNLACAESQLFPKALSTEQIKRVNQSLTEFPKTTEGKELLDVFHLKTADLKKLSAANVEVRVSTWNMPTAWALTYPASKGQSSVLILSPAVLAGNANASTLVLAHELSHAANARKFNPDGTATLGRSSVRSEQQALLTEIHMGEELKANKKIAPEARLCADKTKLCDNLEAMLRMWQDRFSERPLKTNPKTGKIVEFTDRDVIDALNKAIKAERDNVVGTDWILRMGQTNNNAATNDALVTPPFTGAERNAQLEFFESMRKRDEAFRKAHPDYDLSKSKPGSKKP